jgi:hypothetical protein
MSMQPLPGAGGTVIGGGARRGAGVVARGAGAALALVLGLLVGIGWLYVMRGLGWFGIGPRVRDALPLLQLPGFDAQPLVRVAVAWLGAGALTGFALRWIPRPRRAAVAGAAGLVLLLLASQAAYALTRNLRFSDVVWSRSPGLGPVLEAVLFAAGCALVGSRVQAKRGP